MFGNSQTLMEINTLEITKQICWNRRQLFFTHNSCYQQRATKNTLILQSQTGNRQTSLASVYNDTAMIWAQDCYQSLGSSQRNYQLTFQLNSLGFFLNRTRVLFQLGMIQPLLFPDPYMHNHSKIILSWNFLKLLVSILDTFIFPFLNDKRFSSITTLLYTVQEKYPDQKNPKFLFCLPHPFSFPLPFFFPLNCLE